MMHARREPYLFEISMYKHDMCSINNRRHCDNARIALRF